MVTAAEVSGFDRYIRKLIPYALQYRQYRDGIVISQYEGRNLRDMQNTLNINNIRYEPIPSSMFQQLGSQIIAGFYIPVQPVRSIRPEMELKPQYYERRM